MVAIVRHGGHCCGVDHIYDFSYSNEEAVKRSVLDWKRRNASRLLEACLTDRQMRKWAPTMKEMGFKLVTRFRNSNSENVVNVLHLLSARPTTQTALGTLRRHFEWKD